MEVQLNAEEIVALLAPTAQRGATTALVHRIASLDTAQAGDLSFLGNVKYKAQVVASAASVVLVPPTFAGEPRAEQLFLVVDNPSVALARVCQRFEQALWPALIPGVHPSAVVAPGARVAASACVGPLCVIEDGAEIGERVVLEAQVFVGREARVGAGCRLMPGVRLTAACVLHERVRLQAGVVIGSDGFGYEFTAGRHVKVPQVGIVEIGADVEIGANSTIDRARFSRTYIGEGTKIDNLVHIAHNVTIGRHCILCAHVGVAGSSTLEDHVILGGQAGVGGHIRLGRGTKIGGGAGIAANTAPGAYLNGTPAIPYMLERRIAILQQRLPQLFRDFDSLLETVEALKKASAP